ncbi:MAG: N-acetyl-gamma-glutamyl-phosphate reductase [Pirellulaceae bacterium]|jgi:N-acetyl-gamma-glutamyl-phosphate reductase|nr:N-acetyl-gamma-glutamyl-phosphate reductase [Pirellulaceae bacterium]MDP7016689.1 N-acetyl-gamma-glutamyl-phosphate reductase [Pirellulaceae bacterium]
MIRIGVLGATGYTALELLRILSRHADAEVVVLTSRQEGEPHVGSVHPALAGRFDLRLKNFSPVQVAAEVDCVFSCLPHAASASSVKQVLEAGARVIDFSADYRLDDIEQYKQWYGQDHPDPNRVPTTVYGLPELFADQIASADLVANPGCFPTSAILAGAPFLAAKLIEPNEIIVDSKTGISGAGRTPKLVFHYPECNESVAAYNVGRHRHTPEIDLILSKSSGSAVEVLFTPHVVPMDRGILTTFYARPTRELSEAEAIDTLRDFYEDKPFVRVVDHLPGTKDTAGSNFCDLTARIVRGRLVVISCLDNLGKGASGAAVQNFNLMFGFPETTAL